MKLAKKVIYLLDLIALAMDFFLSGGDMKFIQLLLGIRSFATFICPWCKIAKEDRVSIT